MIFPACCSSSSWSSCKTPFCGGPCSDVGLVWVGFGQLFGGLGWVWVDNMNPWTTLVTTRIQSQTKCDLRALLNDCLYIELQLEDDKLLMN